MTTPTSANQPKIYVIEDEADIAELIRFNLAMGGYKVEIFNAGESGFKAVNDSPPDLVLLDIMLPGMSGLQVCERMSESSKLTQVPIIMISAKGEELDIIKGLELGADDYITKPFSPRVLLARVEAVLRRFQQKEMGLKGAIKSGGIELHPGRVEVRVHQQPVDLTQSEFKILQFLAQRPGWVYTRGQIVEAIRGDNYSVTDRTIDFQMVGLRRKLGDQGDRIETVRGVGYRFNEDQIESEV